MEVIKAFCLNCLGSSRFHGSIARLGARPIALALFGLIFSYSAVTFGGFYFSFQPQIRPFADARVFWEFFFSLGVSLAASVILARFSLIVLKNVFSFLRGPLRGGKSKYSNAVRKLVFAANKSLSRYPEITILLLSFLYLGFVFLGLSATIFWFFYTGIDAGSCATFLRLFFGFGRDPEAPTFESSMVNPRFIATFLTWLTLSFSASAFALGMARMQYLASSFAVIRFVGEDDSCIAILGVTADGIIFSDSIVLFHPLQPFLVLDSHFVPFLNIAKVSTGSPDDCKHS